MSDKKTISKERFDKEAANYDHSARFELVRSRYRFVIEEIQKHQFKTWLDVGCGTGALLAVIGEQRKDVQLFGIDLSEEMIKVARERLGDKADLKVSDAERLPFEDRKFDLISCTFSFHHYPHPVEALIEMKRVLSQDGMLVVADILLFTPLRQILNLFASVRKEGTFRPRGQLSKLVQSAGIEVFKLERVDWFSCLMVAGRNHG